MGDIKFIPIVYDRENPDPNTDFKNLIKKDKNSLFIFNDNDESFPEDSRLFCVDGAGNAQIRRYQCKDPRQAVGIPTGSLDKGGYKKLDEWEKSQIDRSFVIINNLLETGNYTKVYYSAEKNGDIGQGTFTVNKNIIKYITEKLKKIKKKFSSKVEEKVEEKVEKKVEKKVYEYNNNNPYSFLSTRFPAKIIRDGVEYENINALAPLGAKKRNKYFLVIGNVLKFLQHPDLQEKLLGIDANEFIDRSNEYIVDYDVGKIDNINGKILTCVKQTLLKFNEKHEEEKEIRTPISKDLEDVEVTSSRSHLVPNFQPPEIFKKDEKISGWRGDITTNLFGLIYLLRKYKNTCTVIGNFTSNGLFGLWWMCQNYKRVLLLPEEFDKDFQKCIANKHVRFILIPVVLKHDMQCQSAPQFPDRHIDHSGFIIYDKKTKTMERFEPHGGNLGAYHMWYNSDQLDGALQKYFINSGKFPVVKYLSPLNICPQPGPQVRENLEYLHLDKAVGGFCTAWSFWYADLRLKNPNMSSIEVIERSMEDIRDIYNNKFRQFIVNYAKFLTDFGRKIELEANKIRATKSFKGVDTETRLNEPYLIIINRELEKKL